MKFEIVIGKRVNGHRSVGEDIKDRGLNESARKKKTIGSSYNLTTESAEAQRRMEHGVSRKRFEDKVLVQLKAVKTFDPIHEAQLLTYMRIHACKVGLLINFNKPTLADGVKRFVL